MADLKAFGGPPQRPSVVDDTPGQTQPAGAASGALRWNNEGFLGIGAPFAIHTEPRGPRLVQGPRAAQEAHALPRPQRLRDTEEGEAGRRCPAGPSLRFSHLSLE